jgi:cysteine synthase
MQLTDLIGNTPLIKLNTFSTSAMSVFAKLEGQNPGGSIKDRVALSLIEDLERKNLINKDKIIIEPSSGNTGIGLAMIGAAKGYQITIMLPETATPERTKILDYFGAKILYCSAQDWIGDTAIEKVKTITTQDPRYVMPNQYENPVCVEVHYQTTATEIIEQCPQITHLIATIGTGGTITGIGKKLKEYNPAIQIWGVEIKPGSKIPGPRSLQGYIPPIIDFSIIDRRIMIEDETAVFGLAKQIAQQEGIFCGISSAAALHAAYREINAQENSNLVVIFPDRGDKYISLL